MLRLTLMIGLSKQPNALEIEIIADFLKRKKPHLSIEEIVVAIEMNTAHELPNKIDHYQMFNCDFLMNITDQYEVMRAKAKLNEKAAIEKVKMNQPQPKQTAEEAFNFIRNHYIEQNEMPKFANWSGAFDHLWQTKQAQEFTDLKAFKEKYEPLILADLNRKHKLATNLAERAEIEIDMQNNSVNDQIRRIFVTKFIEKNK